MENKRNVGMKKCKFAMCKLHLRIKKCAKIR